MAQRLNVIDIENQTMGARLDPQFLAALRLSDKLLAQSPDGLLPESGRDAIKADAQTFLTEILGQSRSLVVAYQQELDQHLVAVAEKRRAESLRNLSLLSSLIILTSIFIVWGGFRFRRQIRKTQAYIDSELEALEASRLELVEANTTVRTLEQLNESKNDFISTVNHELRTPLTSIIGYVDLLKSEIEPGVNARVDSMIDVVDKNALVLLNLVESILSLSKLDSKPPQPFVEEVNLITTVEKAKYVLTPQATAANIKITLDFNPDNDYLVIGDANQLSQVFVNLISNAVKFSPQNSAISIRFSRILNEEMENFVSVAISDQGIGIPEKEIPELFHRFFRASNAVNKQVVGTGLGLAIVAKIVEMHAGAILVESKEGHGSTFKVNLPAFISPIDEVILEKRAEVLKRAIAAIKAAELRELKAVCHEMGGALGIYGLDELGAQVLQLSRDVEMHRSNASKVSELRLQVLSSLEKADERLSKQGKS